MNAAISRISTIKLRVKLIVEEFLRYLYQKLVLADFLKHWNPFKKMDGVHDIYLAIIFPKFKLRVPRSNKNQTSTKYDLSTKLFHLLESVCQSSQDYSLLSRSNSHF